MASRFSATTSGQMPGCPAAILVMSLKPPAASRRRVASDVAASAARFMRAAAVRCGVCETRATSSSWRLGSTATGLAPSSFTNPWTSEYASPDVCWPGVSTQVAPRNRSGPAPSTPSCSEPAMGWPPTKRGCPTADTIVSLIPATSVTTPERPSASCWESTALATSATAPAGTAMKVTEAEAPMPISSIAPSSRARIALEGSISVPLTHQPWRRRDMPMEPPISPVPIIAALRWAPEGLLFGEVIS